MQRLKIQGKLVYDPHRPGFKKQGKIRTLLVELPWDDLDKYYRWFIERHHGQWLQLAPPMYGKHITVIGGGERVNGLPIDDKKWEWAKAKNNGKIVECEYDPVIRNHQVFWSLPVYAEHLQKYRYELGLPREVDFHITIGRNQPWQPISNDAQRTRGTDARVRRELLEAQGWQAY